VNELSPEELRLAVQVQELKARLTELAHENAELRVQRDVARAQVRSLLPQATPEQEEELRKQLAGEWFDFSEVVAEITADLRGGHGDR
jgi:hypothetical protein